VKGNRGHLAEGTGKRKCFEGKKEMNVARFLGTDRLSKPLNGGRGEKVIFMLRNREKGGKKVVGSWEVSQVGVRTSKL